MNLKPAILGIIACQLIYILWDCLIKYLSGCYIQHNFHSTHVQNMSNFFFFFKVVIKPTYLVNKGIDHNASEPSEKHMNKINIALSN